MKAICLIIFWACFLCGHTQNDSVKETSSSPKGYVRLIYENDFFIFTDRYFTQGITFEYAGPLARLSPLSKMLFRLRCSNYNYFGVAIEQNCFTPQDIRLVELQKNERPFAGTLLLRHFLNSINSVKKQSLSTRLDLGIIGPCTMCEEEQKSFHRVLLNFQPKGWENQLQTDLILNYAALFEKGLLNGQNFEVIFYADGRAGTLYTDIASGLNMRLGVLRPYFRQFEVANSALGKLQFYLGAKGQVKLVGYNGTLQGGPFSNSKFELDHQAVERKVFMAFFSAAMAYKRISLEFSRVFITKEFQNGQEHGWGRCNLFLSF
jgi:lipid A 3-O-deacylase